MSKRRTEPKFLKSAKQAKKEARPKKVRRVMAETRYKKGIRHGGRQKGTPNRFPGLLKEALIEAAEIAGNKLGPLDKRGPAVSGLVNYLSQQAIRNPQSFLPLLGRVLPLQIESDGKNIVMIEKIEMVVVDGRSSNKSLGGDEVLSSIEGVSQVLASDEPSSSLPGRVGRER